LPIFNSLKFIFSVTEDGLN